MPQEQERFWGHVENCELGPEPCWTWTAAHNRYGYGVFRRAQIAHQGGELLAAHRYAYELLLGPLPDGLHLHHRCEHKWCCNPFHLQPLTPKQHTAQHSREPATHCGRGHEYTPENIYTGSNGKRWCRACAIARARRNHARKRAAAHLTEETPHAAG